MFLLKILAVLFFINAATEAIGGESFLIVINFQEIAGTLLDDRLQERGQFPVCLPKITPKKFPVWGKITRIETKPWWYPTKDTREYYLKKKKVALPEKIKPGDPKNAMGAAKFIIEFKTAGMDPNIRIHGTNAPESIGGRESRNCIRCFNDDIMDVAKIIKNKSAEVVFVRDRGQLEEILASR